MARRSAGIVDSVNRSELLRAILRHKLMVACIVAVGMAITAGYTASLSVLFRSTASVLIENYNRTFAAYPEEGITYVQDVTKAQRILAQSRPVIQRTMQISGEKLVPPPDTALPPGFDTRVDGQLLYFQVVDEKPERAKTLANSWASAFVTEMTSRAQTPKDFMVKSLEELRKEWMAKQDALNRFKRETNFDPKEYEEHPVRKRFNEVSAKLTAAKIELATLEAEQQILKACADDPAGILQLTRAKGDTALQGLQKQVDLCRVRLVDVRRDYKPESAEVKAAAQSLADALVEYREAAKTLSRQVQIDLDKVKAEHERLTTLVKETAKEFDELKAKGAQYDILNSDVLVAKQVYTDWAQKKGETDITNQFLYSNARRWETAETSSIPYKPNWRQNMLAGLLVSLLVAVACAFMLERVDDTVRSGKDLERRLGVSPLGVIPVFEHTLADADGYLLAQRQADSSVVDSLRNIHIGLEVTYGAHRTGQPLVITVTSAVPHEGKTFLASNLATLFAALGRKVLVVDADLRKGSLTKAFKCDSSIGLREAVASGKWSPEYAVNGKSPGYFLLPVTESSYSSPESLNPEGFARILPQMKAGFDVIIFDTPPVLAVADACVIGQSSDVVLLVSRSRQTHLPQLERAASALYSANVKQVLFVVNGVDSADAASDAYGYGYGYEYGEGYGYGYGYGYGRRKRRAAHSTARTGGKDENAERVACPGLRVSGAPP
ncbi:MAG: AAA family ATPase [Planctomycetota bacterium]|nr:AAA family ATPase [Planctomycetota bacterium]